MKGAAKSISDICRIDTHDTGRSAFMTIAGFSFTTESAILFFVALKPTASLAVFKQKYREGRHGCGQGAGPCTPSPPLQKMPPGLIWLALSSAAACRSKQPGR